MNDIVEKLRNRHAQACENYSSLGPTLWSDAADEIDQLQNELREAQYLINRLRENVGEAQNDLRDEVIKNDRLREALIATGRHLGAGLSEEVSSDFLTLIPEEARLLKAERDRLREERDDLRNRWLASADAWEPMPELKAVEAERDQLREALERIVREWEAAPDPLYQQLRELWLVETMEPAIDAARAELAKEAGK